jgi:hypothetical protein
MAVTSILVTGTYLQPDTQAGQGSIVFTLTEQITNGTEIVPPTPVTATLDEFGRLTFDGATGVPLAANNDPGTTPEGSQYSVQEYLSPDPPESYLITVPYDAAGGTTDISELI